MWSNQNNKKVVFFYVNLQTYYHFKLDFHKLVNPRHQTLQGQSVAMQTWNSPVEYPNMEFKYV